MRVKRVNPIWLLVALNIVFLLMRNVLLPEETSAAIERWIQTSMSDLGVYGYVGLVAGFVLCGFFFVPLLIPLNILGGAHYGDWPGTVIALVGVTLGTAASTVSARYLFSGMRRTLDQRPRLRYFIELADRHVNLAIVMIRFAVFVPYMLQNVALAMTRASIVRISLLTAFGAIPGAAIYSFLGAGLVQADEVEDLFFYVLVPMLLALGLALLMAHLRNKQ